ncbi:MAG TPA: hypothetical protein VL442_10680 [Mucilaginibacter sp.]|nr:hypothetical protein [Mucilaginibacter sp.]
MKKENYPINHLDKHMPFPRIFTNQQQLKISIRQADYQPTIHFQILLFYLLLFLPT